MLLDRLLNVCPHALCIIELKLGDDVIRLQQEVARVRQDIIEMLLPLDADDVPRLLLYERFQGEKVRALAPT